MSRKHVYTTEKQVLEKGQSIIGVPLKNIGDTRRLYTGKGGLGSFIEEEVYGYKVNSVSGADFKEAGVELKTTPYLVNGRGQIRAKERLVCTMLNYMQEYKKDFLTSSFWRKCNTMIIMAYEHIDDQPKEEITITGADIFTFPEKDLLIIKQDWEKIIGKIKAGKAHEISEGDTLYLGACTKAATSRARVNQPFSLIKAKPRAYALKQSYMTIVLNEHIFKQQASENIIKDDSQLRNSTFEDYIISKVTPYLGRTRQSLCDEFKIEMKGYAKNINDRLLAKILGVTGRISDTEEFKKAGIMTKTITIEQNGSIKESMAFPAFKFTEIVNEEWETSRCKEFLEQTKFLFVIFRRDGRNDSILDEIMFWNIPNDDLDEVEKVWHKTVQTIKDGVVLTVTGKGRITNNLPKSTENRVSHVRPHGRNANDTDELPDGSRMTKQCFWFNNTYIREQIERNKGESVD